jgi:hypothetical protein
MQDALWRVLEDPAWVQLGQYNAGIGRDGVTVVCGAFNTRNSFGAYSGMTPFRGEFRGAEFKPAPIAGPGATTTATLTTCEKAGLPINIKRG